MTSELEKKVLVGLGLASLIIAGVTVVYHASTERLVESAGRVSETHQFIEDLSDAESHLLTARMATRAYILTADANSKKLYNESRRDTLAALSRLHITGILNRQQRKELEDVQSLARERLAESDELMGQRERSGAAPSAQNMTSMDLAVTQDPMRDRMSRLMNECREELSDRVALARDNSNAMLLLLMFGAIVEFAFALAAAGVIKRHIRERGGAIEALKRSEAMLRGFYDSGTTMMGIIEPLDEERDVLIVSANKATSTLYPGKPALDGKRTSELGTPSAVTSLILQKCRQSLRENGPVQFEMERPTVRGMRWMTLVVCPLAMGTPRARFSYVMVDQTERKNAEVALQKYTDQLRQTTGVLEKQSAALQEARSAADAANAAKSNFLANMSHEIRTPMTAVVGYADLLGEPGRTDEQRRDWVGIIRRNARHLLELINDILDLSKIEAGKMTIQSVACEPAQIVADVVSMLRSRAERKGVALRTEIEGPLPTEMAGDPLRLRQVIMNLLGNAIKFTEVGEVMVRVWCESESLRIDVRDSGIGMTPAQLERLFKPFTQADETTTRRFGGSGLGLAISHRLVGLMGGSLTVQSEPGMGSVFSMTLPVRTAIAAPLEAPREGSSPLLFGQTEPIALRGRVLIVEDTPDTQRLLSIVLSGAGAEVVIAGDGKAAVQLAGEQAFDLVVMDMQMPLMDGYEATCAIRRAGSTVPIIALTGHAMAGDRERCLAAGCDEYLTKPIDVPLLLARASALLIANVKMQVA